MLETYALRCPQPCRFPAYTKPHGTTKRCENFFRPSVLTSLRWFEKRSLDTSQACIELQEILSKQTAKPCEPEQPKIDRGPSKSPNLHTNGRLRVNDLSIYCEEPSLPVLRPSLGMSRSDLHDFLYESEEDSASEEHFASVSPPERSCNPVPQNSCFLDWSGKFRNTFLSFSHQCVAAEGCDLDLFSVSPPLVDDKDRDSRRFRVMEYMHEPDSQFIFNYEYLNNGDEELIFPVFDFATGTI